MVRHIILWKLKEDLDPTEKENIKKGIKEGLEGLKGHIPGLTDIKVYTSKRLDSSFESESALKGYSVHPAHVAVADTKVRPYTIQRTCLDLEI